MLNSIQQQTYKDFKVIISDDCSQEDVYGVCKPYLEYLYTDEAQEIIAKNGYRPSNEDISKNYADKFDLDMKLCNIQDFGGWNAAYEKFFVDGAIFDEIYAR